MTFSGGDENAISVIGANMDPDDERARFRITVSTSYIDVFGMQLFHKREINFIVINYASP